MHSGKRRGYVKKVKIETKLFKENYYVLYIVTVKSVKRNSSFLINRLMYR